MSRVGADRWRMVALGAMDVAAVGCCATKTCHATPPRPPNIVSIFTDDLGEQHNVVAGHPEIVVELTALIQQMNRDIAAHHRPCGVVDNPVPLIR